MKKVLVFSLAFVLIISALLLVGCRKEPEKEPAAECPHSYKKTVTPPTCTEAGEEKFSCTKCDYYYTTKIGATGHIGGTPVEQNRTEATCTVDGKYDSVVYCIVCDIELSRNEVTIPSPGHTHSIPVEENRTEATCTVDGKCDTVVYCTVCDEELSRKTVTVTDKIHDVQNGVCTVCGGKESTPGLKYSQNDDGTYTVTRIGDCTETDIVIGIYNNRDVTTIGEMAFYDCTSLTSIEFPDSLTTIGNYAFTGCESLASIELPDSLTTIGNYAFADCTSLTSIELSDGLTTIGGGAFAECTSLTSITVSEGNENYKSVDGNLYSKDGKTLIQYAIGKTDTAFTVPEGVTSIGDYAFATCTSLTSIELPDSLTTIGNSAFNWCPSLKSIELPDSLTTIDEYAFSGCDSLTSIVIPDSVTTIGDDAFSYCTSLTSIVIPEGVIAIGDGAFYKCTSLTIYCEVAKKPDGWGYYWNYSNRPVVWGYTGE